MGCFCLLDATSAYEAEALAFIEVIERVIVASYGQILAMYSDHLSLLHSLASPRNGNCHIVEIRHFMSTISQIALVCLSCAWPWWHLWQWQKDCQLLFAGLCLLPPHPLVASSIEGCI